MTRPHGATEPSVRARVYTIVVGIAGPARTPTDAGPDTPLHEDGFWLDSVETLEVVMACEEEFGVVFDWERELSADAVRTSGRLAEVVASKLG